MAFQVLFISKMSKQESLPKKADWFFDWILPYAEKWPEVDKSIIMKRPAVSPADWKKEGLRCISVFRPLTGDPSIIILGQVINVQKKMKNNTTWLSVYFPRPLINICLSEQEDIVTTNGHANIKYFLLFVNKSYESKANSVKVHIENRVFLASQDTPEVMSVWLRSPKTLLMWLWQVRISMTMTTTRTPRSIMNMLTMTTMMPMQVKKKKEKTNVEKREWK